MLKDIETAPPPAGDLALLERAIAWVRTAYAEGRPQPLTALVECRPGSAPGIKVLVGDDTGESAKEVFMNSVRYLSVRNGSPRSAIAFESWIVESEDMAQMLKAQRMVANGQSISRHPLAREMVFVGVESDAGRTLQRLEIRRKGGAVEITAEAAPLFFATGDPEMRSHGTFTDHHVPTVQRLQPSVIAWAARMDRHAAGLMTDEG